MLSPDEYLKLYIESGHFSYGEPRSITVSSDGASVLFLRSETNTSSFLNLYELNLETNQETLLIDLSKITDNQTMTSEELKVRERLRETAHGITSYATDKSTEIILCHSGSNAILFNRMTKVLQIFELQEGAHSLRLSPDGLRIAYVLKDSVWCFIVDEKRMIQITPSSKKQGVRWGVAEFVAAEELRRYNGLWWSPQSDQLLITKVDESTVKTRDVFSSEEDEEPQFSMRYPMAGEANAAAELFVFDAEAQLITQLKWDNKKFEYLSSVSWGDEGVTIKVITRSQKSAKIINYHPLDNFKQRVVRQQKHDKWLQSRSDVVAWWRDKLVTSEYFSGVYCVHIDGRPAASQVNFQSLAGFDDDALYIIGNDPEIPEELHLYRLTEKSTARITQAGGFFTGLYDHGVLVIKSHSVDTTKRTTSISRINQSSAILDSKALAVKLPLKVRLHKYSDSQLPTAVILPEDYSNQTSVPIIMCPYGGPWHQEVILAGTRYSEAQWFAMQGYAVVICDGRGTPGKNESWEYGVWRDLASPVLEDQVTGLNEAIRMYPHLDRNRVGIRGWSFGGYLSALAVLDRPDIFKAGVAGAPVTDWRLYDTFYSEQFLGLPQNNKEYYDACSLLKKAHKLKRPLLMIHGVADDNVLVDNARQFSEAVTAAGKADLYKLDLLNGQTHMNTDTDSVKNALMNELLFFNKHLSTVDVLE